MTALLCVFLASAHNVLAQEATSSWLNATYGSWSNSANWSNGVPDNGSVATISVSGTDYYGVTLDMDPVLNRFVLDSPYASLTVPQGRTLYLNGPGTSQLISGSMYLNGGTIVGGLITATQGSLSGSGTLSGTTYNGSLQLYDSGMTLVNGANLTGSVNLDRSWLFVDQDCTLNSAITITPDPSFYSFTSAGLWIGNGRTVVLGSSSVVRGADSLMAPAIGENPMQWPHAVTTVLRNEGVISADMSGETLSVDVTDFSNAGRLEVKNGSTLSLNGNWSNSGIISIDNGTLSLGGNFTTNGMGLSGWTRNGGAVAITGTLDNTGSTLGLDSSLGSFRLPSGGKIIGGHLSMTGNNRLQLSYNSGTLDGVTIDGDLVMDWASVGFTNGTSFSGANASLTGSSIVSLSQDTTLDGKTIIIDANYDYSPSFLLVRDGYGLTLGPSTLVQSGNGTIGRVSSSSVSGSLSNAGTIRADGGGKVTTINSGSFANTGQLEVVNGGTLAIAAATWSNTGALTINNGTLKLGGSFAASDLNLSQWNRTGGTVVINGLMDNTGNVLDLSQTGAVVLDGATIRGGHILPAADAALSIESSSYDMVYTVLDGAVLDGDLTLARYLSLTNGAMIAGSNLSLGNNSALKFGQDTLLSGKNVILGKNASIYVDAGAKLTIDSDSTMVGTNYILGKGYSSAGTIESRTTLNVIDLSVGGYEFINNGTINVVDGSLSLTASYLSNPGTIDATNSTIEFGAMNTSHFNTSDVTSLKRSGGTLTLGGTMDNSGQVLDMSETGTMILNGGTIRGGTILQDLSNPLVFDSREKHWPSSYGNQNILDGVNFIGDLSVPTLTLLRLSNGTTFTGSVMNVASSGSVLDFDQDCTISSKTINLTGSGAVLSVAEDRKVVFAQDTAINANGIIGYPHDPQMNTSSRGSAENRGTITVPAGNACTVYLKEFDNQATLRVNPGSKLTLKPTDWTSSGTIFVDHGTLNLDGAWSNSGVLAMDQATVQLGGSYTLSGMGMGKWQRNGGTIKLAGHLDLEGQTFVLGDSNPFVLSSVVFKNGVLRPTRNFVAGESFRLDGTTLEGDLTVQDVSVGFFNGGTFTGSNATMTNGYLGFGGDQTLEGKTWTLHNVVMVRSYQDDLIIGESTTMQGSIRFSTGTHATSALVENRGRFLANDPGGEISLLGTKIVNNAVFEITNGGKLRLNDQYSIYEQNDGTTAVRAGSSIEVNAGSMYINAGRLTGSGTITVRPEAKFRTACAVIEPGDDVGLLTFNGHLWASDQATFRFELGSSSQPGITSDLLNVNGNFILDGSLDVAGMSGFAPGTYRLFTYSGNLTDYGLDVRSMPGDFLGKIDISHAGQVNLIVTNVPEPASLGLLALGSLAMLRVRQHKLARSSG